MKLKNFTQSMGAIENTVCELNAMVRVVKEYHYDGDIEEIDITVIGNSIDEHLATFTDEGSADATKAELEDIFNDYGLLIKGSE